MISTTSASGNIKTPEGSTYLGDYNQAGNHDFSGKIDESCIWDDALTAAEITALYNSGVPLAASSNSGNYTSSANLKGYWRFGENTGTTLYDLSGSGNHDYQSSGMVLEHYLGDREANVHFALSGGTGTVVAKFHKRSGE